MKFSYYEDIRTLNQDVKNIGEPIDNAIKNSVSSYLYDSKNLNSLFTFIQNYINIVHKEIKRFKLLYNYTEKPDTDRVNY